MIGALSVSQLSPVSDDKGGQGYLLSLQSKATTGRRLLEELFYNARIGMVNVVWTMLLATSISSSGKQTAKAFP